MTQGMIGGWLVQGVCGVATEVHLTRFKCRVIRLLAQAVGWAMGASMGLGHAGFSSRKRDQAS